MVVANPRKRRSVSARTPSGARSRKGTRSRKLSGPLSKDHGCGDTVATPSGGVSSSPAVRAAQLIDEEIEFIANEAFQSGEIELSDESVEADQAATAQIPRNMPAHLARLCSAELLTASRERELFQRMNYLKFRANELRINLDADRPNIAELDQLEQHLIEARQVRDQIVQANMRLVFSIVKRFVTPQCCFDDLLSEGIRTLMIAVEKFDYGRGFRFSTYAYRAISRNAYRAVTDHQKDSRRFTPSSDILEIVASDEAGGTNMDERTWVALRSQLAQFLDQLDRRERFIIRGRYALGSHRRPRTFQDLADLLGLSKERVRQIEQRAVEKLKKMAAEAPSDDFATAVSWQ